MIRNTQYTVARGETFSKEVIYKNSQSLAIDITDYTFTGSIKPTYSDTISYPFTITKNSPADSGSIELFLDTSQIVDGRYVYTVFAESGSMRNVVVEGDFIIRPSTY